jgi:hypothetical protein
VQSYDPREPRGGLDVLPRAAAAAAVGRGAMPASPFGISALWTWPAWEAPRWYAERKPAFEIIRASWARIHPNQ